MPKPSRTKAAKIRASFGRAERLRQEAGDARPDRAAEQEKVRSPRNRPASQHAMAAHPRLPPARKPPPLRHVQQRIERSYAAANRHRQRRLKEQTRSSFNEKAERRQNTERRTEHNRKRDALQVKLRRVEDGRRKTEQRVAERKREDMRRSFVRAAENRRALDAAARQKEIERRAAIEIEREQKRQAADHQAAHRRQTAAMRTRHEVERDSYRDNETMAMERHHNRIKGIDVREDRALGDFDGRRCGLAGRVAELIPGRRAENDRQREEMKRGYEIARQGQHRDYEAVRERQFKMAQRGRLQQAQERKALMELHRDERGAFGRTQANDRPRLIEDRSRVIDRVDRAQEREREREHPELVRENVRP